MPSIPSVNRVIKALLEQLQVEKIVNSDALANSIDTVTASYIDRIVRVAISGKQRFFKVFEIGGLVAKLPSAWTEHIGPRMEKLAYWASTKAATIFTTEVPRSWMASIVRQKQSESGVKETPLERIHEMPKDEYERLVQRYVLPNRSKAAIKETVYRPAIIVKDDGSRQTFEWQDRIKDLSKKVDPAKVADKIVKAQEEGASVQQLSKLLVSETKGIGASAKRIARTESMRQMGDETFARYRDLGDMWIGVQYLATLDERVRPEHAILHGRIWWRNGRKPELNEMPVPPVAPNCLLPGNHISGRFKAFTRSYYSGDAVELVTRSGKRISVTVNHPIATREGFIAAGKLDKGSELLVTGLDVDIPMKMAHIKNMPSTINKIFDSLSGRGFDLVESVSAFNFHGDAKFMKGNVEIVYPNRELLVDPVSERGQTIEEWILAMADCLRSSFPFGYRPLSFSRLAVDSSASRVVRGIDLVCSFVGWHLRPFQSLRFALIPHCNASSDKFASDHGAAYSSCVRDGLDGFSICSIARNDLVNVWNMSSPKLANSKSSGYKPVAKRHGLCSAFFSESFKALSAHVPSMDAGEVRDIHFAKIGPCAKFDSILLEDAGQSLSSDTEFIADLIGGFPCDVFFDDLVDIKRFHYDGPVYDAETEGGYFFAGSVGGGIALSNCRCTTTSVLSPPQEALDDPGYLAELRALTASSGPDIVTQQQWWQQTDESRKRLAVGSKRYQAMKDKLNREPDWVDFVNVDGGFIKTENLLKESAEQRERRRMAIQMTIAEQGQAARDVSRLGFAI